jgi:PAS domain S-box-containing protein
MFIPHVVLDSYAFIRSDMFEFLPGTRRAGERTALEDLGAPVFIVDTEGRVVTLNAAARRLVDASESAVLTRPLSEVLGVDVDLTADEQRRTITTDGERREYLLTPAPLDDRAGTHVGYTLVFQDVTESVRREQRLTVMNRVLRHNLRNDLNVVQGYVEASAERVDSEEIAVMLGTAVDKTAELARTGEKVRDLEAAIGESADRQAVDLKPLLEGVTGRVTDTHGGTVETNLAAVTVRTDPDVLSLVVENLLENAILHAGDGVALSVRTTDSTVEIVVADEGPGIPDHELETIAAGTETDLVHGSGMGLWVVDWGVDRLGGSVAFDAENGTTATLTLPRQGE